MRTLKVRFLNRRYGKPLKAPAVGKENLSRLVCEMNIQPNVFTSSVIG